MIKIYTYIWPDAAILSGSQLNHIKASDVDVVTK